MYQTLKRPLNRPNIVLITTHDTGRHFGCYGQSTVQSPSIDQLAAEGVRLSQCFCAAPKCSPSRAAMMTGRWPQSNGVMGLVHSPHNWELNPNEQHLSHVLRDAGYATHLIGFQHETEDLARLGFDHTHALPDTHEPDELPDAYGHRTGEEVAQTFAYFCKNHSSETRPFYAQVGFFETHDPLDFGGNTGDDTLGIGIPDGYIDNGPMRQRMRMMQGAIKQVDSAVGQILATLREQGLEQNTLVVFAVDHGLPLKRAKDTLYDRGLEIAMLMRWPAGGIVGGCVIDQMLCNIDLFPTLLALADVPIPDTVQGCRFDGLLRGEQQPVRVITFGCYHEDLHTRCIRTQDYKLIRNFSGTRQHPVPVDLTYSPTRTTPCVELYDLRLDPQESENRADAPAYQSIKSALDQQLYNHLKQVGDPILEGPVPLPFYSSSMADFLASLADQSNQDESVE